MVPTVRPPAVAGSFYPADPGQLEAGVRRHLAGARPIDLDFAVRILIVPHAGYIYSGPVAAAGYQVLDAMTDIRRIVMLGPSHYEWFPGLALPGVDAMGTPLGDAMIDIDGAGVIAADPIVIDSPVVHRREHSLEVQLPFLQIVAPKVPIVPLLTGDVEAADVADVVEPLLDDDTLLLVSSDLSHYHSAAAARGLDAATAASIERLEPEELNRQSACGRTGVQAALHIARRRGWTVQTLDLRNSSDTAGPADRVVGYGTFAIG
jgi:AmmeMemoRadiSam system protein B